MNEAYSLTTQKEGRDGLLPLSVSRPPNKQSNQDTSESGISTRTSAGVSKKRHTNLAPGKPSRHARLPGPRSPPEMHKPDDQDRHLVRWRHPPDHPLPTLSLLQFRRRHRRHDRDILNLRATKDETMCASPWLPLRHHHPHHK